jgi:hypothetical protein
VCDTLGGSFRTATVRERWVARVRFTEPVLPVRACAAKGTGRQAASSSRPNCHGPEVPSAPGHASMGLPPGHTPRVLRGHCTVSSSCAYSGSGGLPGTSIGFVAGGRVSARLAHHTRGCEAHLHLSRRSLGALAISTTATGGTCPAANLRLLPRPVLPMAPQAGKLAAGLRDSEPAEHSDGREGGSERND